MNRPLLATISAVMAISVVCRAGDFDKFRSQVQEIAPKEWKCEEIAVSEGQKSFELGSGRSRYNISLIQTDAISQDEWEVRSARFKVALDRAAKSPDDKNAIADAIDAMKDVSRLPDGRFGTTAVQIRVSEPELSYPDSERDGKETEKIVLAIRALLQPYQKR